eukprot:TRINITY_DN21923_c0_g1_i1.p1 TRINITY_DN21923_c0_g1~~TRINITY_DN21923_c0_g1_i1.p1  ORF type:complete len:143 (+),score=18.19 TRINITY_DN21923_c0_g1_i1:497-925(+)
MRMKRMVRFLRTLEAMLSNFLRRCTLAHNKAKYIPTLCCKVHLRRKLLNMASKVLKNLTILFILISASLLPTSFAGGQWRYMDSRSALDAGAKTKEKPKPLHKEKAAGSVHPRGLKVVHTKDYDNYDPAPALVKPPFKLIPN